jgi:hypothetical protein
MNFIKKRKMNKIKLLFSVLFLSVIFVSCKKDETTNSVIFSSSKVEVPVGKSDSVKVNVGLTPFTLLAADNTIATAKVSSKLNSYIVVTGVKEGTTLITVTDKDKKTGKLSVTVKKVALVFTPTKAEVAIGKTGTVKIAGGSAPYTILVGDITIATATVDKETITISGVKAGTTLITVTDKDKVTAKFDVVVK